MLHTYIHEVCHALSFNRITSKVQADSSDVLNTQSGYWKDVTVGSVGSESEPARTSRLHAFNEGVTERIAQEVFLEYSRRSGTSRPTQKILHIYHGQSDQPDAYHAYMSLVEEVCARIATYAGVPDAVVWNALKRGYFENGSLRDSETAELLKDTFGPDFLKELESLDVESDPEVLSRLIEKYKFHPADGFSKKWLKQLRIAKRIK